MTRIVCVHRRDQHGKDPGAGGPKHPGVPAWLAGFDRDDFVALGHPLLRRYGPELIDIEVRNPAGKSHSITYYLGHQAVATRIADAVGHH